MSNRRPAPRPNRAGEAFACTHHLETGDGPPSSKKPRFDVRNPSALAPDAPEEDAILDLDEIGKGGQRTKRNAVNLDGYNSDSSNEGFGARAEARASQAKKGGDGTEEVEDEEDMFAEEELKDEGGADDWIAAGVKKKDVRFLDEEEIVGQVAGSKSGGHVSANFSLAANEKSKETYSSSSEDEDPVEEEIDEEVGAGGLKKHAPKLDAFNMKNEMEEGRFDAQGNFVRKARDPDAVHDSWLDGVSKKDMKRASEAAKKREKEGRQKALEDDRLITADVLKSLIIRLEKGETVLEALARMGKGKEKKKKPKWHNKYKNLRKDDDNMDIDTEKEPEDPAEIRRREDVEAITGSADVLLTRGQSEIYEATREMLIRQFRRETGEDWVDLPKAAGLGEKAGGIQETKHWEYRWTDGRDGGETYGPYEGSAMAAWQNAGFFGEGVEFRCVGQGGSWSRIANFV